MIWYQTYVFCYFRVVIQCYSVSNGVIMYTKRCVLAHFVFMCVVFSFIPLQTSTVQITLRKHENKIKRRNCLRSLAHSEALALHAHERLDRVSMLGCYGCVICNTSWVETGLKILLNWQSWVFVCQAEWGSSLVFTFHRYHFN